MPRLSVVDPATAPAPVKAIFDGPIKAMQLNIFKGMGNSAAALDAYLAMSGALSKGSLSAKERETIALVVGQANNCAYCLDAHTHIGKGAGLTEVQTIEARRGGSSDPKLNAIIKLTNAIHEKHGFVSEADINAFRAAGYTDGAVAEVIANYALNTYTNFFNHANETARDLPAAPSI
jgi:uncharacterized peroxidase-related enzyme